ncbi:hypothetical protein COT42_00745 [Candidatus Saganbacteria bacterium CG08_land_8_20_14_0_20_45_16]|uniref:RNA-binding protein KhpB n=1 Tax=Candidatus Saganbacteria bacterium CG08_land_8_20_14_0_20_45_16 TaxID=2014293 RepID=A0A2H0Y1Q9_UNCSA|nr:MAG: hypothetical protein COT42_00745 [Candidatus Saganbacteria bacterium CG08_land_8_20_14_0_20_45_16]
MKKITMKGKNVDEAVDAALKVISGDRAQAKVFVLSEGKAGVLGLIGGTEAEVEVTVKEGKPEDAQQLLQDILDKMGLVTMVESRLVDDRVELVVKGDDMGRIIGKDGATLKSLEILLAGMLARLYGERSYVSIDADGYRDKRRQSLERLAQEVANEVIDSKAEKTMPPMSAADRRIIHLYLQGNPSVAIFSQGEGDARRLVIAPK